MLQKMNGNEDMVKDLEERVTKLCKIVECFETGLEEQTGPEITLRTSELKKYAASNSLGP